MRRWLKTGVFLLAVFIALGTWQMAGSEPAFRWARQRVMKVVRPGIIISDISQQERQQAAQEFADSDPEARQKQIAANEGRLPEFAPTETRGNIQKSYLKEINLPATPTHEQVTLRLRVIETPGQRILTQEPGRELVALHSNSDDSYYVFEFARIVYGLDPETFEVTKLVPEKFATHDHQKLVSALLDLGGADALNWASSPRLDPTGRFVAFNSNLHAAEEAVAQKNLDLLRTPSELWLYDRQTANFTLVGPVGNVFDWIDQERVLLYGPHLATGFQVFDPFSSESWDVPDVKGAVLVAVNSQYLVFTDDFATIVNVDTREVTHYEGDWPISGIGAARPSNIDPTGHVVALLEINSVPFEEQIAFVDLGTGERVYTSTIPEGTHFHAFGGWLNPSQFLLTLLHSGPPSEQWDETVVINVPGREK